MIDLRLIKEHLRVPHDLEDDLLKDYIEWAKQLIIDAVFYHDEKIDEEKLNKDINFKRAVVILVAFYYENRLLISEVNQNEAPYSVLNAIQSLRGSKDKFLIAGVGDENENE